METTVYKEDFIWQTKTRKQLPLLIDLFLNVMAQNVEKKHVWFK